jgi:hypothetical protein
VIAFAGELGRIMSDRQTRRFHTLASSVNAVRFRSTVGGFCAAARQSITADRGRSASGCISASLDESVALALRPSRPSSFVGQSPTNSQAWNTSPLLRH